MSDVSCNERVVSLSGRWRKPEHASLHEIKDWELSVVKRAQLVLVGDLEGPFDRGAEHAYRWQLSGANDWHAELRDSQLVIAYRYFHKEAGQQKLQRAADWLTEIFN